MREKLWWVVTRLLLQHKPAKTTVDTGQCLQSNNFWNAWKGWPLTRISKPKTIHLSASFENWLSFALLALTTWTCVSPQITIIVMSPLYLLFFVCYYVMDKKPFKPSRPLSDDKHGVEYTALESEVVDNAKGICCSFNIYANLNILLNFGY